MDKERKQRRNGQTRFVPRVNKSTKTQMKDNKYVLFVGHDIFVLFLGCRQKEGNPPSTSSNPKDDRGCENMWWKECKECSKAAMAEYLGRVHCG